MSQLDYHHLFRAKDIIVFHFLSGPPPGEAGRDYDALQPIRHLTDYMLYLSLYQLSRMYLSIMHILLSIENSLLKTVCAFFYKLSAQHLRINQPFHGLGPLSTLKTKLFHAEMRPWPGPVFFKASARLPVQDTSQATSQLRALRRGSPGLPGLWTRPCRRPKIIFSRKRIDGTLFIGRAVLRQWLN